METGASGDGPFWTGMFAGSFMAKTSQNGVTLPAVVDLDALEDLREALIAALERGPVAVAAAGVERISTNALLLLLSAAETARRNHFAFSLAGVSAPMQAAIDRLGLTGPFEAIIKG